MAPTPREKAALVRRFLTDVIAGGDVAAVDGFLASVVADHTLAFGDTWGHETVAALGWQVRAAAVADVDVADVVTTDRVAVRGTVTGTHRESLMELTPSGRSFEIPYAWVCRVEGDRIAESWSPPDGYGRLQPLDAIPDGTPNRLRTHPSERQLP